jgi:rare lipoprotein A
LNEFAGRIAMKFQLITAALIVLVGCSHQESDPSDNAAAPSSAATPIACAGASYYADSLAGNPTASGEPYVPSKLTAAHRTLSFGTKVRVVREGRGEVTVTINDRGPFIDGRIIDLSRAAAEQVDLITDGVADVCIYAAD